MDTLFAIFIVFYRKEFRTTPIFLACKNEAMFSYENMMTIKRSYMHCKEREKYTLKNVLGIFLKWFTELKELETIMMRHEKNGMWNDMKVCDIKATIFLHKGFFAPYYIPATFCPINMFDLIVIVDNCLNKNKRSIIILESLIFWSHVIRTTDPLMI